MSEDRRAAQRDGGIANAHQLLRPDDVLRLREGWKYEALRGALAGRQHVFEYPVADRVFDLALLDTRVLVEFDGPYHRFITADDAAKDALAAANGFKVVRRHVEPG